MSGSSMIRGNHSELQYFDTTLPLVWKWGPLLLFDLIGEDLEKLLVGEATIDELLEC